MWTILSPDMSLLIVDITEKKPKSVIDKIVKRIVFSPK